MSLKLAIIVVIFILNESHGIPAQNFSQNEPFLKNPKYFNYEELQKHFKKLARNYPHLAKVIVIGKSVKNRSLLALEIHKNVGKRSLLTPMFKYVGNMHGDETLGRQLIIYLAQYLLSNYGKVDRVTKLIDSIDIYLLPSMNPDGFANSREGICSSGSQTGRHNANGMDLNRDFPDRFDTGKRRKRQPETTAMMSWILSNPFVLSANIHGGALVVNYPFDNSNSTRTCCVENPTPDNDLFKALALRYSLQHPTMHKGNECTENNYHRGIVNGAFWYELSGGMQDFNYLQSNCFEVTLELSCCKFPPGDQLPQEWQNNKESLLSFMEATHWGIKGLVLDEHNKSILDADIVVKGINHSIATSIDGEYWRLLLPGTYRVYASAASFVKSETVTVKVVEGVTTIQDFRLDKAKYSTYSTGNMNLILNGNRIFWEEHRIVKKIKVDYTILDLFLQTYC